MIRRTGEKARAPTPPSCISYLYHNLPRYPKPLVNPPKSDPKGLDKMESVLR